MASELNTDVSRLVDHLFRHEAGKMVSVLTRIFGISHLDLAEDVVQDTLLNALQQWSYKGIPENPQGWLYRAAKNKAIDILRREKHFNKISSDISYLLKSEYTLVPAVNNLFLEDEIKDDQLRMMFTCCHPDLAPESQIALTLKTLCGFSIAEISKAFVTNDETITKRIYRAKEKFRDSKIGFQIPDGDELNNRLEPVLSVLYLLFNEGYNSISPDNLIRQDLIEEAIRLSNLLSQNKQTNHPSVHALLALMYFHSARTPARIDDNGNILLLNEQDRKKWDHELNRKAIHHMEESANGDVLTEYHLQAAIAGLHSMSADFNSTDWKTIKGLYDQLLNLNPSPVIALNRAIVIAQIEGPEAGILEINSIREINRLENYYLLYAALGELHLQNEKFNDAKYNLEKALALTTSNAEKLLILKKIKNIPVNKLS